MICCPFPVNKAIFSGDFSIIAALPSLAEPTSMDSETNVFRFRAIAYASSMVEAYCNISLVRMEIGVADAAGRSDLAALMVTVSPVSFYQPENGYRFASVGWAGMTGCPFRHE